MATEGTGHQRAGAAPGTERGEEPWDPMHYGHPRMPLAERAKIFAPFDPLKGFREELRRRERLVEERQRHEPMLPEDEAWDEPPL